MHRKFDNSFKIMAVDLSVVKGFVAECKCPKKSSSLKLDINV